MSKVTNNNKIMPDAAERARNAASAWWRDEPGEELDGLPDHISVKLEAAGIHTAQDLRETGPDRLRKLPYIGPRALWYIKEFLRSLDREHVP